MQITSRVGVLPPFKVSSRALVKKLNVELHGGKTVEQVIQEALAAGAAHNILSATHLDAVIDNLVAGDLPFVNANAKLDRLPKDVDGKFLSLVDGLPAWAGAPGGGGNHNLLSATHPDTLAASVVAGDLLIGNATPKWARLPKDVDGKFLSLVDGLPAWVSPPGGAWVKVEEHDFSDGDTTYTFSGLDGNSDKVYAIVGQIDIDAGGADRWPHLTPNNLTGDTFQNARHFRSAGDHGIAGITVDGLCFGTNGWSQNGDIMLHGVLYAKTGYNRQYLGASNFRSSSSANYVANDFVGQWINTVTNITSLVFHIEGGHVNGGKLILLKYGG